MMASSSSDEVWDDLPKGPRSPPEASRRLIPGSTGISRSDTILARTPTRFSHDSYTILTQILARFSHDSTRIPTDFGARFLGSCVFLALWKSGKNVRELTKIDCTKEDILEAFLQKFSLAYSRLSFSGLRRDKDNLTLILVSVLEYLGAKIVFRTTS